MTTPGSPASRWPLELRLVVSCLRAGLGLGGRTPEAPGPSSLEESGGREPDWDRFLFWVGRHRVTPLVYAGLAEPASVPIPDGVRAELRDRVRHNALRMLRLGSELAQLLEAFDEAGITALPIKGPMLALQVHGDITMRQVKDLDLLVGPGQLDRAIDLLRSRGYRPVDDGFDRLSAQRWEVYRAAFHELALVHADGSVVVELHWNLVGRLWPVTLEELAGRSARVRMAGRDIAVLGPVDLLLHLLVHGSSHAWRRLSWLAELGRLIPRTSDETWREVAGVAAGAGIERPLRQGLLLSRRLFGTPIAEPLRQPTALDRAARSLAATAESCIAAERDRIRPGLSSVRFRLLYKMRLRRSLGYRLSVLHSLARPHRDVLDIALPDRFAWLHYPLRPFLWIRRRWRERKTGSSGTGESRRESGRT